MLIFVSGLVIFFGVHVVRMLAPNFRDAQIIARGKSTWMGIYSLISATGLGLIIWGWILYRVDAPQIFTPPEWGRHVTALLMLVAFIFMIAFNLPAGRIKALVRHPFLAAISAWALGHLLANGDLASALLFGTFFVYAILNRIAVTRRDPSAPKVVSGSADFIAIIGGFGLFLLFAFWGHPWMFGVSPF